MKKLVIALAVLVALGACSTNQSSAEYDAEVLAQNRDYYVMQNDVEYGNYDKRLRLADDPTTLLWCTSAFDNPSAPMFTVAIAGKLTSGGKRPFDTAAHGDYSEDPGPDGMYGSSGEYRYGFTPADVYVDFYNLDTFCTTEPTVFQRESTTIVLETDPELLAAQEEAQRLLAEGDTEGAQQALEDAVAP